ncbi:Uncharacterised protein [Mycobacteroides abscessus subsp. abscessus]|nr:Uncharacterised protein [Mycobacteroides abscessus subsp. abscessus]
MSPNRLLNAREKWVGSAKPQRAATTDTRTAGLAAISARARSSRLAWIQRPGVVSRSANSLNR